MCTPFDSEGEIDFELLRKEAKRLQSSGVDGLVPAGSTGESATLSHDEHVKVVREVCKTVDIPVVAGCGSNSTRETISLSQRCSDAGADALLLISPYYNKPTQEGLENHYSIVADNVDTPQVVYNVPSRTGQSLEYETVVNLSEHENIVAYKAAGSDMARISNIITGTEDKEFSVLSGNDVETLPILSMGGKGCISVAANLVPQEVLKMVHSLMSGDCETAMKIHQELNPIFDSMFVETNPIPIKAALDERGYMSSNLRNPLCEISEENRRLVENVIQEFENNTSTIQSRELPRKSN